MGPKQFNNTSYTNRDGKVIPARASIEYKRKTNSGRLTTTDDPALARDTIITVTPDAPYATSQRIYLSGPNSYSERLSKSGEWVPSDDSDYWVPIGRELQRNYGNQPSYWDQFKRMIGFKQEGGIMTPQFTIKPFNIAQLADQTATAEIERLKKQQALQKADQQRLKDELDVEFTDMFGRDTKRNRRRYAKYLTEKYPTPTPQEAAAQATQRTTQQLVTAAPTLLPKSTIETRPVEEMPTVKPMSELMTNGDHWTNVAKQYGFKSVEDVGKWQKENGLVADGKFGARSLARWNQLNGPDWNAIAKQKGFADTEAVKKWQAENGLVADGKFGPKSQAVWDSLQAAPAEPVVNTPRLAPRTITTADGSTMDMLRRSNAVPTSSDLVVTAPNENTTKPVVAAPAPTKPAKPTTTQSSYYRYTMPTYRHFWKNGGTMNRINYFQQGGAAQNDQANAFMQAILQGNSEAIGQLVQAASQGDKQATQLIETILKEDEKGNQQVAKAATVIKQLLNQTVAAKWGAKLGYIKSLKYAKGGKTCPSCEKKVEMKACGGKKAKKNYFGGLI